jgi:hypothetical protein
LHELGHHFQQPPATSSDSLEKSLFKHFLAEKFLLPFLGTLSKIAFFYDKGLGKYFPGLPYAQRVRKEFRKAGLA